jgi:hypothetical protein
LARGCGSENLAAVDGTLEEWATDPIRGSMSSRGTKTRRRRAMDDRVEGPGASPPLPPLEGDEWEVDEGVRARDSVIREYGDEAAALLGITDARYWVDHDAFLDLDDMLAAAAHRDDPLPLPLPALRGSPEDVDMAERTRARVVAGGTIQAALAAETSDDRRSSIAGILAHDQASWWARECYLPGSQLVALALSSDLEAVWSLGNSDRQTARPKGRGAG